MALKFAAVLFISIVLTMTAEFQSAGAMKLCGVDEDGQEACKPSVTKPDPVDPSPECCKALEGADLGCLCSYKSSPLLPALGVDPDLAVAALKKCGITPPEDC